MSNWSKWVLKRGIIKRMIGSIRLIGQLNEQAQTNSVELMIVHHLKLKEEVE